MFLHADSEDCDQTERTGHFVGFVRPKIIFYLFAIAYLPTLLLPTQLFFFVFSRSIFFFFFFFCFDISVSV